MCNFFWSVSFIVSVKVGIITLNMRDIIIYVAQWWEKYLSKRSPLKHTCSWHDKLIVLQNSTYNVTRDTIKISQESQTEQDCLAHGRRSDTILQIMSHIFHMVHPPPYVNFSFRSSVHQSVHPSVVHHISGNVDHLIIIFGTHL